MTTCSQPLIMDALHRELLSRSEITSILNERYLGIQGIDTMPYEELLRIYKTFAMPLEQRGKKHRAIDIREPVPESYYMPTKKRIFAQDLLAHTLILREHLRNKNDLHLLEVAKYYKLSYNTISVGAAKRHGFNGDEASPPKKRAITRP